MRFPLVSGEISVRNLLVFCWSLVRFVACLWRDAVNFGAFPGRKAVRVRRETEENGGRNVCAACKTSGMDWSNGLVIVFLGALGRARAKVETFNSEKDRSGWLAGKPRRGSARGWV